MLASWAALIAAPLSALGVQSLMYALVTPACQRQAEFWVHASAALALAVSLGLAALARREWKARGNAAAHGADSDHADAPSRSRFVAMLGTAAAALSSLVILTMWAGAWMLSPCLPWP